MAGEFDLIRAFFRDGWPAGDDLVLGVGDDAALIDPHIVHPDTVSGEPVSGGPARADVRIRTASAVRTGAGVASGGCTGSALRPETASALARSILSEATMALAVRGCTARWMTLSLAIPEVSHPWLETFSSALRELAGAWDIRLVGGDTTKGPLNVAIFAQGVEALIQTRPAQERSLNLLMSHHFDPSQTAAIARAGWPVRLTADMTSHGMTQFATAHGFGNIELGPPELSSSDQSIGPRVLTLVSDHEVNRLAHDAPDAFRLLGYAKALPPTQ